MEAPTTSVARSVVVARGKTDATGVSAETLPPRREFRVLSGRAMME